MGGAKKLILLGRGVSIWSLFAFLFNLLKACLIAKSVVVFSSLVMSGVFAVTPDGAAPRYGELECDWRVC